MADDVIVTSGSYSATVAADEVGGVKYQRAKMVWGADGTVNDADVATGKPLPIQLRLSTGEEVGLPANEAAVAGEPGIVWLAVRKDSLGTIADVEGKRAPVQVDANGLLRVSLGTELDSSIDSVTAALAAGTNNIGDVDVLTVPADPFGAMADAAVAAGATGSLSAKLRRATQGLEDLRLLALDDCALFKSLDLDETEEEVKASPGKVKGYFFYNAHASALRFLKFYDGIASGVTVGTTVPKLTLPIKAGVSGHLDLKNGWDFATGICVAATTGLADNDTGAPGANEVVLGVWYR